MSHSNDPVKQNPLNLQLQKRLATYSTAANLAVLSGLALSGIAHAAPVRIEVNPDQTISNGAFNIDFDQDTNLEYHVRQGNFGFGSAVVLELELYGGDFGSAAVGYTNAGYPYVNALAFNTPVGPTQSFITAGVYKYLGFGNAGPWGGGVTDGYVGVRFQLDGATTHYGWILLDVAAGSTSFTIKAYGYDTTPNTDIPTAVNLLKMKADAVAPWWRQAAVGAFSMLTALSLWWRRRVSRRLSE